MIVRTATYYFFSFGLDDVNFCGGDPLVALALQSMGRQSNIGKECVGKRSAFATTFFLNFQIEKLVVQPRFYFRQKQLVDAMPDSPK